MDRSNTPTNMMQSTVNNAKGPYNAENLSESLKTIQMLEKLRLSSIRGNLEGVKNAIEEGISVNQTLKGGWSPLLFSCSMGHPEVVEYLLKKGANPDFHKERFTALMAACASTRENEDKLVKCVELLAEHKADINATERHHISALMFASKEGHVKIVSKLISYKCLLDLQDGQGWTALFWAVNQGKVKVVRILVMAGASTEIKDRRGQTAMDLAYSKGLDEILTIFSSKGKLLLKEEIKVSKDPENWQMVLTEGRKFDDIYEDMVVEMDHNQIIEDRCENGIREALVSIGNVNGLVLKKNQYNCKKRRLRSNANCKLIEKLKQDQNSNCVDISKASLDHPIPWNTPYSLGDAVLLMKTTMKHLGVLYAGTSYIRLRLQGRQVDMPVEKKYSNAAGLASMTQKALHQTQILQDELKFLYQHVKKLEETDKIIPADFVVQKKDTQYKRITTVVLISIAAVLIFNNRSHISRIFKI